jgi:hypothetical protein
VKRHDDSPELFRSNFHARLDRAGAASAQNDHFARRGADPDHRCRSRPRIDQALSLEPKHRGALALRAQLER